MTPQAILILIDRRNHSGNAIGSVHPENPVLRSTSQGRGRKGGHLIRSVTVVAVRAGRVPIAVEYQAFGCVVSIGACRKRMTDLRKLCENICDPWGQIRPASVTGQAGLFIRSAE